MRCESSLGDYTEHAARYSPIRRTMLSRRICSIALGLASATSMVITQRSDAQSAPTQARLDEISERGRALAGYQRAALLAATQLVATNRSTSDVQRYVAYHADSGWVVAFGRLSSQRDSFYISHIAIPAAIKGQRVDSILEFLSFREPAVDTDFLVRAARAMDLAIATLGRTPRTYTAAALPTENGEWWVYLTLSADATGIWPLGDDVRYRISPDGERVLDTHRMHVGIVEGSLARRDSASLTTASWHRSALRDEPEDSDVFHVLVRRPLLPEVVVTRRHRYMVGVDGSIKVVAPSKETVVGANR
jgi:hypothetical protein